MLDREALKYRLVELFQDQEDGALSFNDYIDRILALLRPDPRIAEIEAVLDDTENSVVLTDETWISEHDRIFAILRGDA